MKLVVTRLHRDRISKRPSAPENWPTIMERAVEGGQAAAYPEFGFSVGGRGADFGLTTAPRGKGGGSPSLIAATFAARASFCSRSYCKRAMIAASSGEGPPEGRRRRMGIGGAGEGVGGGMMNGDAHTFIIAVSPLPTSGPSPRARCARRECGEDDDATQLGGAARLLPGEAPAAGSAPSSAPEFADSDKPAAEGTCGAGGGTPSARAGGDETSPDASRARAIARNARRRSCLL